MNYAKPFVKWAGGKGSSISQITEYYVNSKNEFNVSFNNAKNLTIYEEENKIKK